ncbi:zeatin O-glucosyltransferase-like [Cucurbita moschata]|uniref:Glycosyltransferase n=1 Tax=Cucurbita moschata TaxID=3662 RepID=A0A6J1EPY9_CUCMO|nr:zeatin O-glucosyltransferase-like [Cucurbita moschata]
MNNQNYVIPTVATATASENSDHLPVVVVMVPLPAQGHLNQLLHLSRLLSTFHIPIHFVGTATHNCQARLRCVDGGDDYRHRRHHHPIQFHDFDIPPFPSPPPNPSAIHKFPSHLIPAFTAATVHLHRPLTVFLHSLSPKAKRVIVIHDSLMSSVVQGVHTIPNVESYSFHSVSAFAVVLHYLERKAVVTGRDMAAFYDKLLPEKLNVPPLDECFPAEFLEFIRSQFHQLPKMGGGKIYNACRVIEGQFLEVIERVEHEFHHWALGPFNPLKISPSLKNGQESSSKHKCLTWLDQQDPRSVIYVSFGTTTAMEDEQIKEIANGLASSHQKFIWVLRDADKADIFEGNDVKISELPKGYEDLIGDRGLVIREWAPQLEILSHRATGGFMTHCGWNSCMESITTGVPVAAWPMHSDQPRNTVLMTAVLRVGVVVKEWGQKQGEVVAAAVVEEVVRRLMVSEEGAEIRRNSERLGEAVRRSMEDGGDSRRELEAFVAHITR